VSESYQNSSPLTVLFVGGTGTISAACVREAVREGMDVSVLNRGNNSRARTLPDGITELVGDIRDAASVRSALGDRSFDVIVNFLTFSGAEAEEAIALFAGRARQYIHISTAALYRRPNLHSPITESTLRQNDFVKYSRDKIAAEDVFLAAFLDSGFPVTIVRPSHTYDDANPPLPGGWTIFDRIARGDEMVVHGDGTSLWTLTHADDFAVGLVGLIGDSRSIGEAVHITSDDVYTWDQIYGLVAGALGVEPRLVHVPSEFFPVAAPDWFWSELVVGDLSHSALFDNSKIRGLVPAYAPRMSFHRAVLRMVEWRAAHPAETAPDPVVDSMLDRLATGYHGARELFESLAPSSA
jgi:nucleoside-diphosphate-sugar epimerase